MTETAHGYDLDGVDRTLLQALQVEADLGMKELVGRVHMSVSATHKRVTRLKAGGWVRQSIAVLDREQFGFDVLCYLHVKFRRNHQKRAGEFHAAIHAMPNVLECQMIAGEYDYMLKVAFHNHRECDDFVTNTLLKMPSVAFVKTTVILKELKFTTALPL